MGFSGKWKVEGGRDASQEIADWPPQTFPRPSENSRPAGLVIRLRGGIGNREGGQIRIRIKMKIREIGKA